MKKLFILASVLLSTTLYANNDSLQNIELNEVSVVEKKALIASNNLHVVNVIDREQIATLPAVSINELLDYIPGIDIRTRGANGAQADIAMRGGTFDQVLILLNGVNITDVQTGHANLDIPISLKNVDRIEVLQGTSVCQFGLSAFSGAINIITNEQEERKISAAIEGGDYGLFSPSLTFNYNYNKWRFNVATDYNQSTGYINNTDYKYGNLFFHANCNDSLSGNWQLQIGGQLKNFGSNSFYSLKYPDQFEATKTLVGSLSWNKRIGIATLEASALYRGHYDRFELFREGKVEFPAWYTNHNYHITNTAGANFKSSFHYAIGKTTVGVELRNEHILSNVLGDELTEQKQVPFAADSIYFTKSKNRLNVNYFVEQSFVVGNFLASVGFSGNYNSMFKHNYAATANIGYKFDNNGSVYINVNRALRLPTFTDLYYQSATQIANPALKPEESLTAELGVRWAKRGFRIQANGYYRMGKNLIDWVKTPEEDKWHSVNHTRVDAFGGEAVIGYSHNYWLKNIELGYAFCQLNKDAGEMLSKYALDYLRHKLTFTLSHGIYKGFGANWQFTYQQRNGTYTDSNNKVQNYQPAYLLDGRIYWQNKKINIYLDATNLIGRTYYDYGGIQQPSRWVKAGVVVNLDFKQ